MNHPLEICVVFHQAASMVNSKEIPPEAILLGVYLELQNGQISTRHSADTLSTQCLMSFSCQLCQERTNL